jgi:hypothetical protein
MFTCIDTFDLLSRILKLTDLVFLGEILLLGKKSCQGRPLGSEHTITSRRKNRKSLEQATAQRMPLG